MLSPRFEQALHFALHAHAGQRRHNSGAPYASHLLATCATVLEEGGGEPAAIAALLHDVLEDTATGRGELRDAFGEHVYRIVDDCTDADFASRPAIRWPDRKQAHLRRMAGFTQESLLVIAADKLSSLQSLLDDLTRSGPGLFEHSTRSAGELLANYRDVYERLGPLAARPVCRRLGRLITELGDATAGQARLR